MQVRVQAIRYTVKTRIPEHPFSWFRLIGFLYIGYLGEISLKVFLSVLIILLHIFHVIIRLLIPNTVVVHLLYTASEITSIYTEILVQYHSKATHTVCSIFNFKAACVLIYIPFFTKFQPGCS